MVRWYALIIWLMPWALAAQVVPAEKAEEIARSLMGVHQPALKTRLVRESVIPVGQQNLPDAYIVTFKPAGFVIVSAHESTIPVLGYSLSSEFPVNPDHPLRSWLLPLYQASARRPEPYLLSLNTQFTTDHTVLPLTTAKWGQGHPWNLYCPSGQNGKKALVGCVAVAMSQIMEKWQWPPKGSGNVSYTPLHHSEYGKITLNFDTTHYRWEATHDILPTDASALILFHTGAASLTIYDPELSSTSVDRYAMPALMNNFSYNRGMVFRGKSDHDLPEWIRMLNQELDNDRPVLYAGTTPDGKSSHAFILDGYRNETFFHFNWGWNGAGDGWYTLTGMAGESSDFTSQQGAIFGMQPAHMPLHDRPSAVELLAGDGFIQLFWNQLVISDFSHYNIYRNDSLVSQTADTEFRDTGLENSQTYSYRISAYYEGQVSGESAATPMLAGNPWNRMQPDYSQTFESGTAGWQLLDSGSGFRVGTATSLNFGADTGNIAAIRSEGRPPGEQAAGYLISPALYPGDFKYPAVSFDYVFKQNPGNDDLSLIWRDYQTGQWHTIAILDSTGDYGNWKNRHFYLPGNIGILPIQVAFLYQDALGQGFGAAIDNFSLYDAGEPAIPVFSIDNADLCLAEAVTFTDQSKGFIHSWEWDFGNDAVPRQATSKGPHLVRYTKPGMKTVKLVVNHLDHLEQPDLLLIREKPEAAFEFERKFMDVQFIDKSTHADQLLWLFGDGTTSTEPNPMHTYIGKDLYEVSQIAYKGSCLPDTMSVFIDMRPGTGVEVKESMNNLTLYPNPTTGKVILRLDHPSSDKITIRLFSTTSRIFFSQDYPPQKEITLDLFDLPVGLYILQIASANFRRNEAIVKINN